jgi:hypothetical protein
MGNPEDETPAFAKRWTFARVVRMLPWLIAEADCGDKRALRTT